MARCNGRGFDCCDSCVNAEFDPQECEMCEDGDKWVADDDETWDDSNGGEDMTVRDLANIIFLKAA